MILRKTRESVSVNLRHWIDVQHVTTSQDSSGNPIETWTSSFHTWAACDRLGSREFPIFQKRNSQTTARFTIRYRDNVSIDPATYRIVHDSKTWNIYDPIPDPRKTQLFIEASETI